jgi:hypothetical protein
MLLFSCANPSGDDLEKSSNADLNGITLSVGTLTPTFSASVTTYNVYLGNSETSITITGTPAEAAATVGDDSGQAVSLAEGNNWIHLT